LQTQLVVLNNAIAVLQMNGATVTFMTCTPPDPVEGQPPTIAAVSVQMQPPISNSSTLADLAGALQGQADTIVKALEALGYTNDTAPPDGGSGTPPDGGGGDLPKPPGWPDDLPWPPVMPPALPGFMAPGMGPRPMPPAAPPPAAPPPPTPAPTAAPPPRMPPPAQSPTVPRR
jgi:hypothetical protein